MNEIFGQGTVSYVHVRDEFTGDELAAWLAFLGAWREQQKYRAAQTEHDALMKAATSALH